MQHNLSEADAERLADIKALPWVSDQVAFVLRLFDAANAKIAQLEGARAQDQQRLFHYEGAITALTAERDRLAITLDKLDPDNFYRHELKLLKKIDEVTAELDAERAEVGRLRRMLLDHGIVKMHSEGGDTAMTSRTPTAPLSDIPGRVLNDCGPVEYVKPAAPNASKLWLWKNGDHYLAFDTLYPNYEGGDPKVLGEPVGYALFEGSAPNASDIKQARELYCSLVFTMDDEKQDTQKIAAALVAARQEERAKTEMVEIEQFFPKGTQLRSPGGFSFDLKLVAGLSAKDEPDGYLDVFLPEGKVRCTFDRNSHDSGPPAIFQIKRNIEAAIREAK